MCGRDKLGLRNGQESHRLSRSPYTREISWYRGKLVLLFDCAHHCFYLFITAVLQ